MKLAVLSIIILLLLPITIVDVQPQPTTILAEERDGWLTLDNGVIVVKVPIKKAFPMYFWWIKGQNETIYASKYLAIAEIWLPPFSPFNHREMFKRGDIDECIMKIRGHGFGRYAEIVEKTGKLIGELARLIAVRKYSSALEIVDELISEFKDVKGAENIIVILYRIRDLLIELESNPKPEFIKEIMEEIKNLSRAFKDFHGWSKARIEAYKKLMMKIYRIRFMPFLIPFAALKWEIDGPYNITDTEGNVIGMSFSFISKEAKIPGFKKFDRIEIRNRLYAVPVKEYVENQSYIVYRGEIKNDIIIEGWKWNIDKLIWILGNYSHILLNYTMPKLVLISHFNIGFKYDLRILEELIDESGYITNIANRASGFRGLIKTGVITFESDKEFEGVFKDKIEFMPEIENGTVIAGFFRFVPYAYLYYPDGSTETINVDGWFWIRNRHLFTFLIYPYFNNATLEHDPSVGVSIREYESPQYIAYIENGEVIVQTQILKQKPLQPIDMIHDITSKNILIITVIIIILLVLGLIIKRK